MKLKVFYDRENKEKIIIIDNNLTVKDLLARLNINPVTVIVSKNNEIILESDRLNDKDDIKIISVISGG